MISVTIGIMKEFFLILFVIVITDPYQGLDYESINVYDFTNDSYGPLINVVYPESETKGVNETPEEEARKAEIIFEFLVEQQAPGFFEY